jgi:hypothetical protein
MVMLPECRGSFGLMASVTTAENPVLTLPGSVIFRGASTGMDAPPFRFQLSDQGVTVM